MLVLVASTITLPYPFASAVFAIALSPFKMKRRLHTCTKLLHCKVTNSSLLGQITMTEIKNMW
jgi:hypothetical protein